MVLVPDARGVLAFAVLGLGKAEDPLALAAFSERLPAGLYALGEVAEEAGGARAALGWLLGTYDFTRYRKGVKKDWPKLVLPAGVDGAEVSRIAEGVFLGRDLVNTPSNDLGPEELAAAARRLAKRHGARVSITQGAALKAKFPLIHAVGKASVRAPRLIDMVWG
ncbi:MAG: leucyl aminopeptidase family protein, partial [Alphaproteobacteria bacterium]|nr:leucyl aminopeptidase family protein [Alphaproteobacteria bacterium]